MSYLVLARKYRPRILAEIVGQEHVVQALTNALQQQRLHHAYLFTGTRGVGKTTISRALAKALNCATGMTPQPCGTCQACCDIDAGRFVDYTELDAASNRGVDEIQQLLDQAVYKPMEGRFKVFMIDEVHMLTSHAFNSMLKTLEEPPEYLKFVLATTDPQKVPVTVLSRCLQFNLRPMAPETIATHLVKVLDSEGVAHDPMALHLIARAAHGSMRDALSLTDQAIAFGAGQLQESGVRQMLGSVDQSHVFDLLKALAQGQGATVLAHCQMLRDAGYSAGLALEEMARVLQRAAVHSIDPKADRTDIEASQVAELAGLFDSDELQFLYSLCIHGRSELGLAPDEHTGMSMVLLRFLAFCRQPSTTAEKKTLTLEAAPIPTKTYPPPAEGDFWDKLVATLIEHQYVQSLPRELAVQSQLMSRDQDTWLLRIESTTLQNEQHRSDLELALARAGHQVHITLELGPVKDSPAMRQAKKAQQNLEQAEQLVKQDPFVQHLISKFDAKIVLDSIQPL